MKLLLSLNHNHFRLYDEFMKEVPEFKQDQYNWNELLVQIFISLSNNVKDFVVSSSSLPVMDRLMIDDRMHEPDFFSRLKNATRKLCLGIYFLCYEMGLYQNGVFDYTIIYTQGSLVVLISNQSPG